MGSSREAERRRQSAAHATSAVFLHVKNQIIFHVATAPERDEAQTAAKANKGYEVTYKATNEGDP